MDAASKKRRAKSIKRLHVFNDDANPVRVWFDIKEKEVCFRRKRSRKVLSISLRDLHAKLTGQIVMPFV